MGSSCTKDKTVKESVIHNDPDNKTSQVTKYELIHNNRKILQRNHQNPKHSRMLD